MTVQKGSTVRMNCTGVSYVKSTVGPITSLVPPVNTGCAYRAAECYEMNFTLPCDFVDVGIIQSGSVYFDEEEVTVQLKYVIDPVVLAFTIVLLVMSVLASAITNGW